MKRTGILANFRGTSERGYRLARMRDVVCVHAGVLERLLEEARRNRSAECCGLLAGKEKIISEVLQHSALRFRRDRKSTRLNSSPGYNSYARFCFKKKKKC